MNDGYFSSVQGSAAKVLWLVEEGVFVEPGAVLCKVDSYDVQERLRSAAIQLGQRIAEAAQARTEESSGEVLGKAELAALREELRVAEAELERLDRFDLPARQAELRAEVEMAEQQHEAAARKLEVIQEFFERGFASEGERAAARRELQVEAGRLGRARQEEESFREGGLEAVLAKKRVEIARTSAKLAELGQRRLGAGARVAQRLASLQEAIAYSEEQVTDLRRQVDGSTIRARSAGIVVYGEVRDSAGVRRPVQVGDLVWSNVVLVRVADLSQIDFVVRLPEQRAKDLDVGQHAVVRLSADPGEPIEATLRRVGAVSLDPESGVRSLEVKLGLVRPPSWARPGMSGRARIELDVPAGAVVLPHEAIRVDGDRTYVNVSTWWWGKREREVQVLAETPEGVALANLAAGTRVLLPDPEP